MNSPELNITIDSHPVELQREDHKHWSLRVAGRHIWRFTESEAAVVNLNLKQLWQDRDSPQLNYVAVVCGGRGPDVWDKEIEVQASSMTLALLKVESQIYGDAVVVSIEQKD